MKFFITALLLATAAGSTATAQTAATNTAISAADMKTIGKCKAMKHDAMARSAMCAKMVQLYPNQFANTAGTNG
ncbi:hypothetical protein [Polymorphobacter megasporae]|uniref:hypothetical protein n=1 Tax=Glacieibacterium megasporae TaxID=2835787 RepID=UPI001C1DFD6D|nr:hypothetical protein [Polymorphobacter megasporae]UAJ11613.1 hypothetical protein KTC28_08115 [Polymorphobacter megasporae]